MQRRMSLPDLLCALYFYSVRLANGLDPQASREAADSATARGEPEEYIRLLTDPAELSRRPTDGDDHSVHDDAGHRINLCEPKDRVVMRLREAGKPVAESEAWDFAVEWLEEHLPSISDVEGYLEQYCKSKLVGRAPPDEKEERLAVARGGIRGRAMLLAKSAGMRYRDLVPA